MAWIWIEELEALAIHEAQLAEHGGDPGPREPGLLQCYRAPRVRLRERFSHRLVEGDGVGTPAMALCRLLAVPAPAVMETHPRR